MTQWLDGIQTTILGYVYTGRGYLKLDPAAYAGLCLGGAVLLAALYLAFFRWGRKLLWNDRSPARSVFLLVFSFYALATTWVTILYPPVSDEPHYLMIAQSLLRDRDIDLANNFDHKDFQSFYPPMDALDAHGLPDDRGRLYSYHAPAFPLLIAPALALGGRFGVQLFLNVLAALLAAQMFLLCVEAGCSKQTSFLTTVFLALGSPLMTHASLVFTELPAALIILFVFRRAVLESMLGTRTLILTGLLLCLLVWIHTKYALPAVLLAGMVLLNLRGQGRKQALLLLIGLAGALWLAWFLQTYYGWRLPVKGEVWRRDAPPIFSWDLGRGFLGMFFDRDFGLIAYQPLLLLTLAGWGLMRKEQVKLCSAAAALIVPFVLLYSFTIPECWSGAGAPGRMLVPVLPLLAPFLARIGEQTLVKGVWQKLGILGVGIGFLLNAFPFLRFYSGREKALSLFSERTGFDPLFFLPKIFDGGPLGLAVFYLLTVLLLTWTYLKVHDKIRFFFKRS